MRIREPAPVRASTTPDRQPDGARLTPPRYDVALADHGVPHVSSPHDPGEREAEQAADRIMRMPDPAPTPSRADTLATTTGQAGQALPLAVRNFFEPRFGHDFGRVRVHTGPEAASSARAIDARAYTIGRDIVFDAGQYATDTLAGRRLLAHELAHVVQQGESARRGSPSSAIPILSRSARHIQRAPTDASVKADLQAWASKSNEKLVPTSENYPHQLWSFAASLIQDPVGYGAIAKPKSTDKAKLAEWTKKFEQAEVVAKWLLDLRKTSTSDTVKDAADGRAQGILAYMVEAGLVSKGLALAPELGAESRKLLHAKVLGQPSSASATELATIVTAQCTGNKDPATVPVVQTMTNGILDPLDSLDADRTNAIFKALITAYGSHDKIVDAIAQVLMFNPSIRKAVSDAMMAKTVGSPELLFKVLKHKYFVEPGYGGTLLSAAIPKGMSVDDYETKRMKDDMPWVYEHKQKYYVAYLIDLAKSQSITIAPPANMAAAGLRAWLESNTEKIGAAANKQYPTNPDAVFEIYRNIADIFFFHVPHDRDVKPDLAGKISHLVPGAPSSKRLEADCDVFATYAMRLVNSAGFTPIGYIVFVPTGADQARSAHVGALIRKNGVYSIITNKGILAAGVTETKVDDKKLDALKALRRIAFNDAYGDPKPAVLIYYDDAEANGKMSARFHRQDASLARTDL